MSGRFLLDTNIIIALFGDDASVKNQLAHADEIFTSSTVMENYTLAPISQTC